LFAAYINDTVSISFQNGPAWKKNQLQILVEDDVLHTESVINIYSEKCFSKTDIYEFIEKKLDYPPTKTEILPNNKSYKFSPHHGKKELEAFWNKLKRSVYVESAVSTNWGGKKFIRKIELDGKIELVLVDTAHQYAMLVQTTRRNYHETETIAQILKEEYS
jgi:hypothetical protein